LTNTVYLSLGSNLGDRVANLREATSRLRELGRVTLQSSIYETEPVEVEDTQPWFLNCAVVVETELEPAAFLDRALAIEQAMGRQRTGVRSARTVDVDVLFFGNEVIRREALEIPHPRMAQRRFVLEPLAEIAPQFHHPVLKRTVRELLNDLPEDSAAGRVRKLSLH